MIVRVRTIKGYELITAFGDKEFKCQDDEKLYTVEDVFPDLPVYEVTLTEDKKQFVKRSDGIGEQGYKDLVNCGELVDRKGKLTYVHMRQLEADINAILVDVELTLEVRDRVRVFWQLFKMTIFPGF